LSATTSPTRTTVGAVLSTMFAHGPLWAWRIMVVLVLILMYIDPLARGVRHNLPDFGTKLCKSPSFAFLGRWEETKNLEGTHLFALALLSLSFFGWEVILRSLFGDETLFQRFGKPDIAKRVTFIVVCIALFVDCFFLYCGVANRSWRGAEFSFYAVFATLGYLAVNVGVSLMSVFLSPKARRLRNVCVPFVLGLYFAVRVGRRRLHAGGPTVNGTQRGVAAGARAV
jgi:hypothetical protein